MRKNIFGPPDLYTTAWQEHQHGTVWHFRKKAAFTPCEQAYLLRIDHTPYVKIGSSVDPRKRQSSIRLLVPGTRVPLVWLDGGLAMECRLQLYFWRWHIRNEWFWFPCDAFQPITNLYQLLRETLALFRDEALHPDQCWTEYSHPWEPAFITDRGMRRKDNHTDRQVAEAKKHQEFLAGLAALASLQKQLGIVPI